MSAEVQNGSGSAPGQPALQPVDTREARERVARQAKELQRAAQDLEQMALLEEEPFEEAFFLTSEELTKRYTAENAKQIEWRRATAIYMLARDCPKVDIAKLLHMNKRTLEALASQSGKALAKFSGQYADELLASGAGDFALADTKKEDANYIQLVTGGAIKTDKAIAIKAMSGGGSEAEDAIELEAENPALKRAREFLAGAKPVQLTAKNAEVTI